MRPSDADACCILLPTTLHLMPSTGMIWVFVHYRRRVERSLGAIEGVHIPRQRHTCAMIESRRLMTQVVHTSGC
jgi:hypothetical protein